MVGDWALCHATHKIVAAGRPEYTPDLPRDACAKTSYMPQKLAIAKISALKLKRFDLLTLF